MTFGICTAGTEEAFEQALLERAKPDEPFVYLEIGVAHCETWQTVCEILNRTGARWRTIGIDPWVHAFEAYRRRIEPEFNPAKALLLAQTREEAFRTEQARIGDNLDFVFIDGCHAKPCVMGDFLAVEPLVRPGGLVVFHDLAGSDGFQQHCQQAMGVKEGLTELGLLDGSRPGWKRLDDWVGDGARNGATCGVFEKV